MKKKLLLGAFGLGCSIVGGIIGVVAGLKISEYADEIGLMDFSDLACKPCTNENTDDCFDEYGDDTKYADDDIEDWSDCDEKFFS